MTRINPVSARKRKRDAVYPERRQQVWDRGNGMCERCGWAAMTDVHHLAGRGGVDPHRLANLAGMCRACHEWTHANPAAARDQGWMISRHPSGIDPA